MKPGLGVNLTGADVTAATELAQNKVTFTGMLEHAVPTSLIDAAARNDALQITLFTILFAIGLTQLQNWVKKPILSFCESLAKVMFKIVEMVMKLIPIGVGAAIAVTVGRSGVGVLR